MDPVTIALVAGAASAAIGGGISYFGQQQANDANRSMNAGQMAYQWGVDQWTTAKNIDAAREASERSAYQSALARDWTKYMSDTSYRRGMYDMKAAGLNPILAYAQGGATAPAASGAGAAQASASAHGAPGMAQMQNELGGAVTSAAQAANTILAAKETSARIGQIEAQTALAATQNANVQANTALQTAQAVTEGQRPEQVRAQTRTELSRPALTAAQAAAASASAGLAGAQTSTEGYRRDLVGQQAATEREETGRRAEARRQAENETERQRVYGTQQTPMGGAAGFAESTARRIWEATGIGQGPANDPIIGPIIRYLRR